jgi:hypothetical protein
MISLNIKTLDNVSKLIESLSNAYYSIHIWIDDHQAHQPPHERWYTVEIADRTNNENFIFDSEDDIKYYTLDEAKEFLGID